MKDIQSALKQRLAQKNMAKLGRGAFAVQQAKQFVQFPQTLTGYCKNNILTLKLDHREDKTRLFVIKPDMLQKINTALYTLGYTYELRDIRL